jgi:hypothetical protein
MEGHEVNGRALVVGSPGDNLRGVDHDVRTMAELLRERGFAVEVRTGDRATRAGILAGYNELIAQVRPDEPAVFYYAGHGFRAVVECEPLRSWQGISPTDLSASTTDDFRGITAWELSIKQAQLTARTNNVTVILDCCYASQMSRDGTVQDAVPRALPHPFRLGFAAHLDALRAQYGAAFDAVDPSSNRDAVRLVACGQDQSAFEYPGADGTYRGVFTEALREVLREVGDAPVSWAEIGDAIRGRVLRRFPIQRPDIEGPAHRRLFSREEVAPGDAVTVDAAQDRVRLGAGHLMGVALGDVYGVMPPGSREYRSASAIAELTVREVFATSSAAAPRSGRLGDPALPRGAIAFPIEKTAVRRAVRIDVPAAARDAVAAAVMATPTLRLAEPGEVLALATLRLMDGVDGALTIEDRAGVLYPPARFPHDLQAAVKNLANLAAAQGVRELEGEHGVRADELAIAWGTVDRGQPRRMAEHGSALALGDKVYVTITRKAQRTLHAHIFNIGLRGKIRLLTHADPAGVALSRERPDFVLGQSANGAVLGVPLSWPAGMPREGFPRTDELVVIVTSTPVSLRSLETVEHPVATRGAGSKLQDLLAQLQDGRPCNLRGSEPLDGFYMKRLSCSLHPIEGPIDGRERLWDADPKIR